MSTITPNSSSSPMEIPAQKPPSLPVPPIEKTLDQRIEELSQKQLQEQLKLDKLLENASRKIPRGKSTLHQVRTLRDKKTITTILQDPSIHQNKIKLIKTQIEEVQRIQKELDTLKASKHPEPPQPVVSPPSLGRRIVQGGLGALVAVAGTGLGTIAISKAVLQGDFQAASDLPALGLHLSMIVGGGKFLQRALRR